MTRASATAPAPTTGSDRAAAEGSKRASPNPEQRAPVTPEIGGPEGLEPTRYGDWERNGRCSDF